MGMRYVAFVVLTASFCVMAGIAGPAHDGKRSTIYADKIVADEFQVRSRDGKTSLLIKAAENGVGLWLTSGDQTLSLVADSKGNTGPSIGVISTRHIERGCQFAICAGQDGQAYLQVVAKDGEPRIYLPGEVIEALDRAK